LAEGRFVLNVTVCGKFHYPKYLKYLEQLGALDTFYCSHKFGSNFDLHFSKVKNHFLKEYLMYAHIKAFKSLGLYAAMPFYHNAWQRAALKSFRPADINHFMIHGNCQKIIDMCKSSGKLVIGEAVNAHPARQKLILEEEGNKRKIKISGSQIIFNKMLTEFSAVDYLLVPSKFVERTFLESGYPKQKIILLPYGVDNQEFDTDAKKTRQIKSVVKILCVGQIILRKGQYYLLEAVKSLNARSLKIKFELTLVGSFDRQYMDQLKKLSVDFHHIPHIHNNDMQKFMAGFDIFVIPSLEDGFGVVVSEALAAGLPVVATTNVGAADIIKDGVNGVIVMPASSKELERGIQRIVEESINGHVKSLPSWKDYAYNLHNIYLQKLSAHSKNH
jgi:glycosyltransferase involved in cell wall biosynthesis